MSSIVKKSADFAKAAHESIDQRRKYTNEPYIVHPQAVAAIVATVTDDEAILSAAWLHDVVEDTPVTLDQLRAEFGDDIANLVSDLTNTSQLSDGNRKTRKAIDRAHSAQADPRAKTVKLADIIDNLSSIAKLAPSGYVRKYLAEKELQLAVLKDGDSQLWKQAKSVIAEQRELINN